MSVFIRVIFIGFFMMFVSACSDDDKGITKPENGTYLSQCVSPDGVSSANVEYIFDDESVSIRDYMYDNPDCTGNGGGDLAVTSLFEHSDVDLGSGVSYVRVESEGGEISQVVFFVSDSKVYIPNFPETEPQGDETPNELEALYSFFIEDPTNEENYGLLLTRSE